ncbi:hypothetical protein RGQ13_16875 [Thalassotalea psychrophila]|uniref:Transporter n=1 Tax=Thalassotalea psychrophila TaxID=3065647 RepID=A0ABY9TTY6_9GAMM|nr:hypothetical protein RGQ13_16875 [Colwelliaceae bacterium SQ149]
MKSVLNALFTIFVVASFNCQATDKTVDVGSQAGQKLAEQQHKEKLEAQQLAAKGTGLDPTEVIGRIEFNYTYLEQKNGTERHSGVLKLDTDLDSKTIAGMEVPLSSAKLSDGSSQNGIGDVGFNIRRSVYVSPSFSVMAGGGITLDTASDDQLGDGSHNVSAGVFTAWRHGTWMIANITSIKFHEDHAKDLNSFSLVPLIAYQPMGKYLSYVSLGLPFSYRYESEDEVMNGFLSFGKVMANKDVYSVGSKFNISGPDNDDFVLTIGYKRLF